MAPLTNDLPYMETMNFHIYMNYHKGSQIHLNTFGELELRCKSAGQTVAAIMWKRSKAPDTRLGNREETRDVTRDDT